MDKLSVIIPCYNEEGNVEECVGRVPLSKKWDTEILVVDDGSVDDTTKIAKRIKKKGLKVVGYKKNRGKGYAFRYGLKHATGDVVVILDADMTSPPEDIPLIVGPLFDGSADFVNGTRFIYSMESGAMKWLHRPGNWGFAKLVSLFVRKNLTDSLCGYKAFRRKSIPYTDLKEDSWPDFELLIQAGRKGLRIEEVAIHYKARKAGVSKMKTFSHGWKMLKMLWRSLFS